MAWRDQLGTSLKTYHNNCYAGEDSIGTYVEDEVPIAAQAVAHTNIFM